MDAIIQESTTEAIRFGYGETSLGLALVALSSRGVAAILLGDDRPGLGRELSAAFPGVGLVEDAAGLAGTLARVVAMIDAPAVSLAAPLDLRGSALQLAVWQALRDIPAGETRSYGAVARSLPIPATAQEVGAACAANLLAVAIPCHRVVKVDGSIAGYRWGVQRKRRLLQMEAAA